MNGEEKPRQRRSDALINRLLEMHFPHSLLYRQCPIRPIGELPPMGSQDVLPLNLIALPLGEG